MTLTNIQRAVLEHLCQGATDDAISRRVEVSERTVRHIVADICQALGAASRFQLGVLLAQEGLLDTRGGPPVGRRGRDSR